MVATKKRKKWFLLQAMRDLSMVDLRELVAVGIKK